MYISCLSFESSHAFITLQTLLCSSRRLCWKQQMCHTNCTVPYIHSLRPVVSFHSVLFQNSSWFRLSLLTDCKCEVIFWRMGGDFSFFCVLFSFLEINFFASCTCDANFVLFECLYLGTKIVPCHMYFSLTLNIFPVYHRRGFCAGWWWGSRPWPG